MAGSDPYQGSLSGIPGMVSGIAGILSGILRNSVRLRPECCPESSGMGVRHRPEHAPDVGENAMNSTTARFKATFSSSRPRKATGAPTLATAAPAAASPSPVATSATDATVRPPSRAARMLALAHLIEREIDGGRIKDCGEAARL